MSDSIPPQQVTVTDVRMRFGSMVVFMVKWAIASIPAVIILVVIGAVAWGVIAGLFISASAHRAANTTSAATPVAPSGDTGNTTSQSNPEQLAYLDKIVVRNITVGKSDLGESGVFGEIKNTGDRTLKKVEITIYCLGSDGKPVFDKTYDPVLVSDLSFGDSNEPLKAEYSRRFGVKMDDAPSDWTKKVDVKVTAVEFQ
jgi:hypothetical protein